MLGAIVASEKRERAGGRASDKLSRDDSDTEGVRASGSSLGLGTIACWA
jgi:hypothetical protein